MQEKKWYWHRSIIGYFSHLTPTVVWHNVPALTTITSTVTDGVVWSWACYHYSREAKFFKHFIVWFCLFPHGNLDLFILKWTIQKNELSLFLRSIFSPSALICLSIFPKLWGKDGSYSSAGRGRKSSLSHFQIRRLFLTASSWHYGGDDLFFFPYLGNFTWFLDLQGGDGHLRQPSQ